MIREFSGTLDRLDGGERREKKEKRGNKTGVGRVAFSLGQLTKKEGPVIERGFFCGENRTERQGGRQGGGNEGEGKICGGLLGAEKTDNFGQKDEDLTMPPRLLRWKQKARCGCG